MKNTACVNRLTTAAQGHAVAGDIAPHLLALAGHQLFPALRLSHSEFICRTDLYPAKKGSEEAGVAKRGKRSATRLFSTLNDFLSTSAKVARPRKSSRICTRCPADSARTTMPEKPMKTPSAMLTSAPGITPSSTSIGSSDSKHCRNSKIAASGTAGIFWPKCTKLLMPVTCLTSSKQFSRMQRTKM